MVILLFGACGFDSYFIFLAVVLIYNIVNWKYKFYSFSNYIVFLCLIYPFKILFFWVLNFIAKIALLMYFVDKVYLIGWLGPTPTINRHFLRTFTGLCYCGSYRETWLKPWNREAMWKVPYTYVLSYVKHTLNFLLIQKKKKWDASQSNSKCLIHEGVFKKKVEWQFLMGVMVDIQAFPVTQNFSGLFLLDAPCSNNQRPRSESMNISHDRAPEWMTLRWMCTWWSKENSEERETQIWTLKDGQDLNK